jgi:hypothetical protein
LFLAAAIIMRHAQLVAVMLLATQALVPGSLAARPDVMHRAGAASVTTVQSLFRFADDMATAGRRFCSFKMLLSKQSCSRPGLFVGQH